MQSLHKIKVSPIKVDLDLIGFNRAREMRLNEVANDLDLSLLEAELELAESRLVHDPLAKV